MKHLDLFSGIGGFALAARWAGIETVAFCEIDSFCRKVLKKHWPDILIYADVKKINFTATVDILTAGFPCQPFSVAGKKKGIKDERYLWPETFRIIRQCKPNWIILENVPGIIPCLDPILEDLERESYDWTAYLIPASEIGAPHKRERIWIIANRHSKRCNDRSNNWQERYIQDNHEQYISSIYKEWSQFIPESWQTFNAQDWFANTNSFTSEQTDPNAESKPYERYSRMGYTGQDRPNISKFNWEKDQPPIPGVDDGLPNGLDRNKALGNSIVPQIPYVFMSLIKALQQDN